MPGAATSVRLAGTRRGRPHLDSLVQVLWESLSLCDPLEYILRYSGMAGGARLSMAAGQAGQDGAGRGQRMNTGRRRGVRPPKLAARPAQVLRCQLKRPSHEGWCQPLMCFVLVHTFPAVWHHSWARSIHLLLMGVTDRQTDADQVPAAHLQ